MNVGVYPHADIISGVARKTSVALLPSRMILAEKYSDLRSAAIVLADCVQGILILSGGKHDPNRDGRAASTAIPFDCMESASIRPRAVGHTGGGAAQ